MVGHKSEKRVFQPSGSLDHVDDKGKDDGGGYNPGSQRGARAAGKRRRSGALGPAEVSTPLSMNAATMRCAVRSDIPVALSTSPRGISPPRYRMASSTLPEFGGRFFNLLS